MTRNSSNLVSAPFPPGELWRKSRTGNQTLFASRKIRDQNLHQKNATFPSCPTISNFKITRMAHLPRSRRPKSSPVQLERRANSQCPAQEPEKTCFAAPVQNQGFRGAPKYSEPQPLQTYPALRGMPFPTRLCNRDSQKQKLKKKGRKIRPRPLGKKGFCTTSEPRRRLSRRVPGFNLAWLSSGDVPSAGPSENSM